MRLPCEAISAFKLAWLMSFGEEIDHERAEAEALRLLGVYAIAANH